MRRRSAVRDTLEYWMALAVVESLAWTPLPVANWLARRYAGLLDMALPRLRRVALGNLAMALPQLDRSARQRIADGVFRSIARLLVAFARFPRLHRGNLATGSATKASNTSKRPANAAAASCLPPRTWAIGS
jgi:lauroyl/myristoyl acyltransferase